MAFKIGTDQPVGCIVLTLLTDLAYGKPFSRVVPACLQLFATLKSSSSFKYHYNIYWKVLNHFRINTFPTAGLSRCTSISSLTKEMKIRSRKQSITIVNISFPQVTRNSIMTKKHGGGGLEIRPPPPHQNPPNYLLKSNLIIPFIIQEKDGDRFVLSCLMSLSSKKQTQASINNGG